jgi:hypothetical protein
MPKIFYLRLLWLLQRLALVYIDALILAAVDESPRLGVAGCWERVGREERGEDFKVFKLVVRTSK